MNPTILEALAVTCAVTNTEMPEAAVRVIAGDLAEYPEQAVIGALVRCRREVTGRLTLAAILERLDDGRPGPEEAWAASPRGELDSIVWTPEWRDAYFAAAPHIDAGDLVAGRMAFLERYRKALAEARASGAAPTWVFSPGHDIRTREPAVQEAVIKGRITTQRALAMLPTIDPETLALLAPQERDGQGRLAAP